MKLHPERILVRVIGMFLLVGGLLAIGGLATGNRGWVRAGSVVMLAGGAISFLPLLFLGGVLFYERFIRRKQP